MRDDFALEPPLASPLPAGVDKVIAAYWSMTPWEQERFLIYMRRMAARDPEVYGLADLYASGRITRRQFFELMV